MAEIRILRNDKAFCNNMHVQDPLQFMAPAMVVTTFDVTKQKETELELQALKLTLQRCRP